MTKEGWIILGLIGLYFAWPALAFVAKLFFEGLFAGLGVRASGVVRRLSQKEPPKNTPEPPLKAVFIKGRWRIRLPNGRFLRLTFSTREAAEQIISEIERRAA